MSFTGALPAFHVDLDGDLEPLARLRHDEERELAEIDRTNWGAINTILASRGAAIFMEANNSRPVQSRMTRSN